MFKFIRNVVVRSFVISAVVVGLAFGSYWLCKGLAWASTHLVTILAQVWTYAKSNVPVMILVIVLVTIANVAFELVSSRFNKGGGNRKMRKKISEDWLAGITFGEIGGNIRRFFISCIVHFCSMQLLWCSL